MISSLLGGRHCIEGVNPGNEWEATLDTAQPLTHRMSEEVFWSLLAPSSSLTLPCFLPPALLAQVQPLQYLLEL